jgi:hypothetical protein
MRATSSNGVPNTSCRISATRCGGVSSSSTTANANPGGPFFRRGLELDDPLRAHRCLLPLVNTCTSDAAATRKVTRDAGRDPRDPPVQAGGRESADFVRDNPGRQSPDIDGGG